jgi:tRNA threonylcarbamoyladenosine biosynthesis protein TsaB
MKVLIVDSSKKRANVQVITEDKVAGHTLDETEKHSENLLFRIDEVLNRVDIDLSDIDVYAAIVGPGSFTGIRVGLSTIKAFNLVNNKKLVSLNAFEPFTTTVRNGVVLLNSTRTSFYYAVIKNSRIIEMDLVNLENIDSLINGKKVYMLDFEKYIELKDYNISYIDNYSELLRDAVQNKIKRSEFVADNELEPLYLQLSQAEIQLKNKN